MKNFRIVCVAAVAMLGISVVASAADRTVSKSALSKMGLGGMRRMTDKEGLAVRGMGATSYGSSVSKLPGQTATSTYLAKGNSQAQGSSLSVTGVATNHFIYAIGAGGASAAHH